LAETKGYWRFETGTPNTGASGVASIIDSSGFGDHGTPFGGPIYRQDVPSGTVPLTGAVNTMSLQFKGDDRVAISSKFPFHGLGDATLEFWLKFIPTGHQSVFWTRPDDSDINRYNIFVNGDGTFNFDYREPTGSPGSPFSPPYHCLGNCFPGTPIPAGAWTHLAIVRTGNTYALFKNCALVMQVSDTSPVPPDSTGWQFSGRSGFGYQGFLDEVRISDTALIPSDLLCATPITVTIDIKPGSYPNSINLGSGGTVPVAIFSTATFDAATLDPTTVTLAGAAVKLRGNGTPMTATQDINLDGRLDLVVHVTTEALQLSDTDTEAVLEGKTYNGKRIRGSDTVRIVP
jgi:hypothetical protein